MPRNLPKCSALAIAYHPSHTGDDPPSDYPAEVLDAQEGEAELSLLPPRPPAPPNEGSVVPASCVLRLRAFAARWLSLRFFNHDAGGAADGGAPAVGLRQLKLFAAPRNRPAPAHPPGAPTWVENPASGPAGPALNRLGADSVFPAYRMPPFENAGAPARAADAAIGLPADFSLLLYSVPCSGISRVPAHGSFLLRALAQTLEAAHHKHPLQARAPPPPAPGANRNAHLSPAPYKSDAHLSPAPYKSDVNLSRSPLRPRGSCEGGRRGVAVGGGGAARGERDGEP